MRKATLLFLLLLFSATALRAQLFFDKTLHDFGTVIRGEVVSHTFQAQNVGKHPVNLKEVGSNCACLKTGFTTKQVLPGKSAPIELAYNSADNLGPFEKAAIIQYDGATNPVILTVKGNVVPGKPLDPNTGQETTLPDTLGFLAVSKKDVNIGYVSSKEEKEIQVTVKNLRKTAVTFSEIVTTKPTVEAKLGKMTLQPGEETTLTFKFIGKNGDLAGYAVNATVNETVYLLSNDATYPKLGFMFTAIYERIFTDEEKANAAVLTFDHKEFDAGDILQGQILTHAFTFTNTGKSDLIINSVKASCGCTAVEPTEKVIKPGQSSKIEARFDSNGKSGPQSKTITVATNDPANPYIVLTLKCNINVNPFHMGGN